MCESMLNPGLILNKDKWSFTWKSYSGILKYPKNGRFGEFGGKYIPETLVPAIEELEENYLKFKNDKKFKKELEYYLKVYAGRPTPLYYAKNLSENFLLGQALHH